MKPMKLDIIIYIYLITFPLILPAQPDQREMAIDTIHDLNTAWLHFTDLRLEHENRGLQLTFDTLTENSFNHFKEKYKPRVDTSFNRVVSLDDCSFQLIAADTAFVFQCIYGFPSYNFLGYFPDLKSYLVMAEGYEHWQAFLIDSVTAKGLPIFGSPVVSPNRDLMLTYETDGYTGDSYISLVDISEFHQLQDLNSKQALGFFTEDWGIDELVWIDNSKIALKITVGHNEPRKPEKVVYLKAKIEERNTGANKK